MTAVELLPPAETTPDNPRWHELRRAGVTASEIAAVLGISPWESAFSLYWRKLNDWQVEATEAMRTGTHLEPAIADWFGLDHLDHWELRRPGLYAHADRPWQLATPDRLLYSSHWVPESESMFIKTGDDWDGLQALLECKWVGHSWDGWGEQGTDEIPVYYRAQCLWQLDVLGVDEVHVAALGPGGFRAYLVRRDEADLEVMRAAGEAFVKRLEAGGPPDLDSHSATLGALKRLHPSVGEGDLEVGRSLTADYVDARRARRNAEAALAVAEAEIRMVLGSEYSRAVCEGATVASRSVFTQSRIDTKRLKAELPEIAAEYATTTTVDKLTPGRTKTDD